MRTAVLVTTAAFSFLSLAADAQQKPSFSGRWVATSPAESVGQEQVVVQDAKTLTVEQTVKGVTRKQSYQLDGVERRMAIPGRPTSDITILSTAAWDANRIVINTNIAYPNGMKTQSKETWSIDEKARLVIDYSERGPTGPGPTMKVVYVKKQ
jgi:hypothetical protein